MWHFKEKISVKKFIPMLVKMKEHQSFRLRFVVYKDNMVYLATKDTFGEVMPNGITPDTMIYIWEKWA